MKTTRTLSLLLLLSLSVTMSFTQDLVLPENFPAFTIEQVNDPDPGYLFIFPRPQAPIKYPGYLTILDTYGTPVFYQYLSHQSGLFKVQPSGLLTYLRRDAEVTQVYLMDSSFNTLDSVWMEDYKFDTHDFIAMENGHFLLFGLDLRILDMSKVVEGGQVDATVKGCVIQELDAQKNVVFEWNSFDHFQITDSYKDLSVSSIDYVHPNSLDIDADGNILLVSRAMNELTKIDRQTGEIIWRLGGKNNQFEFEDSVQMFSMPHSFNHLSNGHYTLFDNGNERDPSYSRGIEYKIDEENKTINRVWEFEAEKAVFGPSGGSVQRLPSGNTVHCYGGQVSSPSVIEAHFDGSVAWSLGFNSPGVRAANVVKLPWKTTLFSTNTDSVNFGQWDGYTQSVYILRVKNQSREDLELTGYHVRTNAFTFDHNLFPLTLAPGEEKSLNLIYYPYDIKSEEVNDVLTLNSDINTDTLIRRVAVQVHLKGTKTYVSVGNNSQENFRVYPNPAGNLISISMPASLSGEVKVYSLSGALIFSKIINDGQGTIDISTLGKGIYIIEMLDDSGKRYYRDRIVKL
jgi:hypothetical protein